jgi:hypothetical protein
MYSYVYIELVANVNRFRPREYVPDEGPIDPVSGAAGAIMGTATSVMMGVADFPIQTLKLLNIHPDANKSKKAKAKAAGAETSSNAGGSSSGRPTTERSLTQIHLHVTSFC